MAESFRAIRFVGFADIFKRASALKPASRICMVAEPSSTLRQSSALPVSRSMMAVARKSGTDVSGSVVSVEVAQGPDSQAGYGLPATIRVDIPGMEPEQAQELANAAHAMCPYSKATRGNIDVEVTPRSHR